MEPTQRKTRIIINLELIIYSDSRALLFCIILFGFCQFEFIFCEFSFTILADMLNMGFMRYLFAAFYLDMSLKAQYVKYMPFYARRGPQFKPSHSNCNFRSLINLEDDKGLKRIKRKVEIF